MGGEYIARRFWIQEPGRGEVLQGPLDPPGRDQVLVRTLFSGISRGTESLVYRGRVPESQYEAMRAPFQEGDFPAPVKYGYMSVGVVEEEGPVGDASEAEPDRGPAAGGLEGTTVFCLHPHQDRYVVPRSAVTPLPGGVPPERAVLAANMETALTALWDGEPFEGGRVVVVGAGVVGLLIGWLARVVWKAEPLVVDLDPSREAPARALGVVFSTRAPEAGDALRVFHASGSEAGLRSALRTAGDDGVVVEASWFGDAEVSLPLGEDFHARRLTLRGSQVGAIPPGRRGEWTPARRMGRALELLRDDALDALISGESPFEELPRAMEEICGEGGSALCHRIRYPAAGAEA